MKQFLIILILLVGDVINFMMKYETYSSPSGLVFIKEDDIVFVENNWTLGFMLNITDYKKNIEELKRYQYNLETILNIYNDKYELVIHELDQININSILELERLVQYIVDKIRLDVDERIQDSSVISGVLEGGAEVGGDHRTTLVRMFHKEFTSIREYLNKINGALQIEIQQLKHSNGLNNVSSIIKYTRDLISYYRINNIVSQELLSISTRIETGLEMALRGKLSSSLVSLETLVYALANVSELLDNDLKLIYGLNGKDIYRYISLGKLSTSIHNDIILISLKLPLISANNSYKLYKLYSLPVRDVNTNRIVRTNIDDNNYFIISNDGQYYSILLDNNLLLKCTHSKPKICPPVFTLNSAKYTHTCISSVYLEERSLIEQYCKYNLLIKEPEPIWLFDMDHRGWLCSIIKPIKVKLRCPGIEQYYIKDIELVGLNILANVSHCEIIGNGFKLMRIDKNVYPIIGNNENSQSKVKLLKIEKEEGILKRSVADEMMNPSALDRAVNELRVQGLVTESCGQSEEVSMELLLARLIDNKTSQPYIHANSWKIIILPAFVALMVAAAASYLVLYYDKNHVSNCSMQLPNRNNRLSIEEPSAQALKD